MIFVFTHQKQNYIFKIPKNIHIHLHEILLKLNRFFEQNEGGV